MARDHDETRAGTGGGDVETGCGRLCAGRYYLDRVLGKGGMGEVFKARDTQTGATVALKVLSAAPDDRERVERFKREIGVLSKINHAGVPRILDWGVDGGREFFVSEFVDGRDLRAEIKRRGRFAPADAASLAATVADVLAAAHAAGIVHRDVTPGNIMIDRDGAVRVLDFGVARESGVDTTTLTKTGMVVGTPTYMSPEQFDNRWIDARSDIYSLGVVLFELLTGRPPFDADTVIGVAMAHKQELPPAARAVREDVPGWLDRVILKCLEKRPERRFASAAALATELRRVHGDARLRRLPSGDWVSEDDEDSDGWALVLQSDAEKTGWKTGIVLLYYDRYYKLHDLSAPLESAQRWTYRFRHLPQTEVIRTLINYRDDCAERRRQAKRSIGSTLRNWISSKK